MALEHIKLIAFFKSFLSLKIIKSPFRTQRYLKVQPPMRHF
jgi:hypothetical protein